MLPWNEGELAPETMKVSEDLVEINRCGLLTINSQPHANAAKSTDPVFGWGGAGGYVYQKVYKLATILVKSVGTLEHLQALN